MLLQRRAEDAKKDNAGPSAAANPAALRELWNARTGLRRRVHFRVRKSGLASQILSHVSEKLPILSVRRVTSDSQQYHGACISDVDAAEFPRQALPQDIMPALLSACAPFARL